MERNRYARRLQCGRGADGVRPMVAVLLLVGLGGCAAPGGLPRGTPIAQAESGWSRPTGRYPLPGGGTRLEFAQGAFGKQTYMLDFDTSGLLVASTQVLTEANLAQVTPGTPGSEVQMRFGRPAYVFAVPRQRLQVWNYRFIDGDCVWYQISVSDVSQQVTEAGVGTDPACDLPD